MPYTWGYDMPVISVRNLDKYFGDLHVLKSVNLDVHHGETVAIIGPSGSGKSTLLRCLIHLETASTGDIIIQDKPLLQDGLYVPDAQARVVCAQMGMVFQSFNLFPHMTVLGNLTCAPICVKGVSKTKAREQAMAMLGRVGLKDKADAYPSALSGGQKQRVAIARALMMEPELLLFDEPTSSLDPQLTAEVLSVMRTLAADHMTMVVVTHEMGFAREAAHRVHFMYDGSIVESGSAQEVFESPRDPRLVDFMNSIL